jgi:hypothetical protein
VVIVRLVASRAKAVKVAESAVANAEAAAVIVVVANVAAENAKKVVTAVVVVAADKT